jgi:hypothetical protein
MAKIRWATAAGTAGMVALTVLAVAALGASAWPAGPAPGADAPLKAVTVWDAQDGAPKAAAGTVTSGPLTLDGWQDTAPPPPRTRYR